MGKGGGFGWTGGKTGDTVTMVEINGGATGGSSTTLQVPQQSTSRVVTSLHIFVAHITSGSSPAGQFSRTKKKKCRENMSYE